MKKNRGKVCMFQEKYLSLQCQNMFLTIQVSFLRGQAVYVTTHLYKAIFGWLLLLSKVIHHHFQESST